MSTAPHKLIRRYVGTSDEVIKKLREDGVPNTAWYDKVKAGKFQEAKVQQCGSHSVYWLKGNSAYTLNSTDNQPYLEYRKTKAPELKPCWYCAACETRFYDEDKVTRHRKQSDV